MKRILSLFIAAVMLLLLPADMLASGISGAQQEPTRVKQLDELRESNSDTYLLSDGSYECVVYAADKYYKDDSGKYVEIDHSIVRAQSLRFGKSYAYKNAAGDASAYFADNEPRVCVEMNGSSLSFSLSGANRTSARAGEASAKRSVHEYELFGKNYISYENVLNGTDLIYEMLNGCLKEYVLLKDRSAPSEYTFIFDAPELAARKTENGTVEFINAVDEPVFELGALFAVDSNGEYTDALEYTVRETGQKGRYEITVSVSKDYLNAPERAFPVLVDPTVNIYGASLTYDSFVSETNAATNYQMDQHLRTGKDAPYGVRRTYIKFVLPSDITGATISDAYIRIKKKSGTPPTAKVCRVTGNWNSATINWFKKPGYTAFNSGALALVSNDWYKATVTAIVQEWASGTSNYGFIIKDNTENNINHWTTFYSSDAPAPNRPELHIIYMPGGTTSSTYYINNKYWGKYIHKLSASNVNTVSGLVSNYGSSIRWVATNIGNGRYTLHPENDATNYLVDDTTSGVRLNAVPTTDNIPNKFLWSITTVSGNEKLIKNLGTNRYISQSSSSSVTPVTGTGTAGTDSYKKCVWRMVASNDYRELSNFAIPTRITVDAGQTKTISFSKSPTGAMWCDPSDFSYSFSSGTSGAVSINSSTGKITGQKCGIATYTVTHKVTGRSNTVKVYVDSFTERLANHFDFADNVATLIREVYDRVDTYYPNESVYKRAWRSSRLLSSFVYNNSNFNDLAGIATPFSNLKNYFTKVLNFTPLEYDDMLTAIENNYTSSMPDFAHEQYALSTRLAYKLELGIFGEYPLAPTSLWLSIFDGLSQEEKSYFGGWLGDATFTGESDFYNNDTTILENDDYCADLDAENIFRMIENGQDVDIVSAYKTYHSLLTASNTRAKVFKTYVDYEYVKEKIYYILVVKNLRIEYLYAVLTGNSGKQYEILDQINDEDYIRNEIRTKYPDTYNFLNSLRDGLAELRSYE